MICQQQGAGISNIAAGSLDICLHLWVPGMQFDLLPNPESFRLAFCNVDPAKLTAHLHVQNAIECDPAHQTRVSVMSLLVAIFPNPVVRLAPMFANVFGTLAQHFLRVPIEFFVLADEMRNGLDYFTINVQLHLLTRLITDSNRMRVGISI